MHRLKLSGSVFAGSLCLLTAILLGCGGGGGGKVGSGSAGGGVTPGVTTNLKLAVALPAGYKMPSGGLFLSGGQFNKVALSGTSATVTSWTNTRQLVGVVDANGNPVMMGWVGPGHVGVSPTSTAIALLYFSIGGYGAPDETQESLVESLEADTDLAQTVKDVTSQIATGGNIASATGAFRTDIQQQATRIIGNGSGVKSGFKASPHGVTIDPSFTSKSGLQVGFGTSVNDVSVTNTFRRRALLFLDQISTTDAQGVTKPFREAISSKEIAPASSTAAGSFDVLDSLGGFPLQTTADLGTVPTPTGTTSLVTYVVTAAGPGINPGDANTLTSSEQSEVTAFLQKSFAKDFFLPLFNRILLANALNPMFGAARQATYNLLENDVDVNSAASIAFVESNFPKALAAMQKGDYVTANQQILTALGSPSAQSAMATYYDTILSGASLPGGGGTVLNHTYMLKWISVAIGATSPNTSFAYPQYRDVAAGDLFDTWQVQTNQTQVALKANPATVLNDNPSKSTSQLAVTLSNASSIPKNATLVYTWSTTGAHGDLTVGANPTAGKFFSNTSSDTAVFGAYLGDLNSSEGIDTVSVSVGYRLTGSTAVTQVGTAKTNVEVDATHPVIRLVPSPISVMPGATTPLIQVSPLSALDLTQAGLTLQWHCPNKLGTMNAPTTPSTQLNATYTAGPNQGSEMVFCDVIQFGKVVSTGSCLVKIEKQPTVEAGTLVYRPYTLTDPGSPVVTYGCTSEIVVPRVAGAKSYSVHCYNFNDPPGWGTQKDFAIDAGGNGANPDITGDGSYVYSGSAFYEWGPGGTSSNNPGFVAQEEAYLSGRLAGMQIVVTVNY